MTYIILLLGPFAVLIFKKFDLKRQLIHKFNTKSRYFDFIALILVFPFIGLSLFTFLKNISLNPLAVSMYFLWNYLKNIPEDMR